MTLPCSIGPEISIFPNFFCQIRDTLRYNYNIVTYFVSIYWLDVFHFWGNNALIQGHLRYILCIMVNFYSFWSIGTFKYFVPSNILSRRYLGQVSNFSLCIFLYSNFILELNALVLKLGPETIKMDFPYIETVRW